jgi:hypothetical protein
MYTGSAKRSQASRDGGVVVAFEETAPRQRADLGSAQALEKRNPSLEMRVTFGLGADHDELRGMIGVARGVCERDHAAERGPVDDRLRYLQRIAERPHVVAPLREVPVLVRVRVAAPIPAVIEIDDLRDVG